MFYQSKGIKKFIHLEEKEKLTGKFLLDIFIINKEFRNCDQKQLKLTKKKLLVNGLINNQHLLVIEHIHIFLYIG